MDYYRQQLAAAHHKIKELTIQINERKKVQQKGQDEDRDLVGLKELLANARASAKCYESFIKLAMKDKPSVTKNFSQADNVWIQAVTGVNTTCRDWTDYTIDDNILPRLGFQTKFEEIAIAFHQNNEAGRRIFLNLFLSDIILRTEFDRALRIFRELSISTMEPNGPEQRILKGRIDYTVGFAKGLDGITNSIPQELHLVAVEAKTSIGLHDITKCVAEAATLYKNQVDAGKTKKSVWGILSNAEIWKFIFIDEAGILWQCDPLFMDLFRYKEIQVLRVYRMVYYLVKCCYDACTPPSSTTSSFDTLNQ